MSVDIDLVKMAPTLAGATKGFLQRVFIRTFTRVQVIARAMTPVDKGSLKAAWTAKPGNPSRALEGLRKVSFVNSKVGARASAKRRGRQAVAPHARVIDRGRKPSHMPTQRNGKPIHATKATFITGSPQAPQGISGPTGRRVMAELPGIVEAAAREVGDQ